MAKKILIVEDDTFLQGLAATKLMKEGYTVGTAGSVTDVDKYLEKDTPDFVLLDLVLPGTDGYGILQKLRANPKTAALPVIIFSNLAEDKDIAKAKELGATDFMIKSNFTLDELADKIKSLIGQ
jgi:two-component system phosphate regulon response regulator PhoB